MEFSDGVLTLEGEVEHIAAKKLGLELAIAVRGVTGIVDRLHIAPATSMGDGAILDAVRDALLQETTLMNCSIHVIRKGQPETVRKLTDEPRGSIRVSVDEGVVLLDDHVTGLMQKRLAGVLAWWVPGSRDVINGMEVVPDQSDSDEEIAMAERTVLKKDPFVNELLALFAAAGLAVVDRIGIRPMHRKAGDRSDPLHVARSAEVTSLWRLAPAH